MAKVMFSEAQGGEVLEKAGQAVILVYAMATAIAGCAINDQVASAGRQVRRSHRTIQTNNNKIAHLAEVTIRHLCAYAGFKFIRGANQCQVKNVLCLVFVTRPSGHSLPFLDLAPKTRDRRFWLGWTRSVIELIITTDERGKYMGSQGTVGPGPEPLFSDSQSATAA